MTATTYNVTQSFLFYQRDQLLNVFQNGETTQLTFFLQDMKVSDSLIAFRDLNVDILRVYKDGKVHDYYQPEAYMPVSDVYIEKDLSINDELDKLRLRATSSLLSGRRDIIVVASVSCIYGMGNPTDYENGIIRINKGQTISRQAFLHALVNSLYNRTTIEFNRATFRVKGDTVDINLPYVDYGYRITFFGDEN